jgi:hypothetical protein
MAFVIANRRGSYEVRESRSTPDGPRSRTLATFREMNDEVVEKARARSAKPLSAKELKGAAARAGAPIAAAPLDQAARETLRRVANGERLDPLLRRLLIDALGRDRRRSKSTVPVSDAAIAATEWIGASLERRGEALRDLLELADALPVRIRAEEIGFPRLKSA